MSTSKDKNIQSMRRTIDTALTFIWDENFADVIERQMTDQVLPKIGDSRIREEYLKPSLAILKKAMLKIRDVDYLKEEDPDNAREILESLQESFKYLLKGLLKEHGKNDLVDDITNLSREFYSVQAKLRGIVYPNTIQQSYSPIITLIKFSRNMQKHEDERPIDLLTEKKTYANIFTNAAIAILSIYAYKEILDTWYETESVCSGEKH